jgi:hypothetical protein
LQTSDRRWLKASGRHQISTDGKHLIDGVAFGRPFLRHPDRPTVRIPSIKRARLVYDDANDVDSHVNTPNQLILRDRLVDEVEDEYTGIEDYGIEDKSKRPLRSATRKRQRSGLGIDQLPPSPETGGMEEKLRRIRRSYSRQSSRSSTKSVRFERNNSETPATVAAPVDSEDSEDDEDFNPDETESDVSEGNKENVEPESEVSIYLVFFFLPG